ncbi:MAG TPA: biotin transporter BioY [Candidatus Nanopelagicaceae bacterium]
MSISAISLRNAVFPRTGALSNALFIGVGTIFLAGLAQIALPIPGSPVPVTGQTLGVLLIGTSYGAVLGLSTFLTYLLVGLAGAPVFAGGGHGLARLTGATGGYLVGMLVASLVIGWLAGRAWDQHLGTALPTMLLGDAIIFSFGLFWLHNFTGKSWSWTLAAGFTPFIIGEILKIAIAGTSLPIVWRFVHR